MVTIIWLLYGYDGYKRGDFVDFIKIKAIANEYSDLFIKDEEEFMKRYHKDVLTYSIPEQMAIFDLTDIYHACKTGVVDKDEVLKAQKDIREIYEGELAKVI